MMWEGLFDFNLLGKYGDFDFVTSIWIFSGEIFGGLGFVGIGSATCLLVVEDALRQPR